MVRAAVRGMRVVCIGALLAGLGSLAGLPHRARAATTLTVTGTADGAIAGLNGNGTCDLREAIQAANTNATVNECTHDGSTERDTITFAAATNGTPIVLIGGWGDDTNAGGDLDILGGAGDLTITGNGAGNTIIDGNANDRIFDIDPGNAGAVGVSISGVTIQSGGRAALQAGGGIRNARVLTLTNSTLITNTAHHGGGLFDSGTATLNGVTVGPNNSATNGNGGGISGGTTGSELSLTGCTVISNTASAHGGGLFSVGSANADNSDFTGNQAANNGGGLSNGDSAAQLWLVSGCAVERNTAAAGGGVFNAGTAVLDNVTIGPNNSATAGNGGGIGNAGPPALLTVTNGTIVRDNTASGQGGGIWNAGTANLDGVTVGPNNTATAGNGGGISNGTPASQLTVTDSAVISDTAGGQGGGIFNTGTTTVDGSDVSHNQAGANGGGISTGSAGGQLTVSGGSTVSDNSANNGGGIWSLGTLTVTASTVGPENRATAGGGGGVFNQGTGTVASTRILNNTANGTGGGILNSGTLLLDDVTVGPGNSADSGGGINSTASATELHLTSCDVLSNTAANHGGGIMNHSALLVHNGCWVADNTAATGEGGGLHNGVDGTATVDNTTVGGGNHAGNNGGGIWNAGAVTVTNESGVVDNTAGAAGGGMFSSGQARVFDSTVSGNAAQDGVGGGISNGTGAAQLTVTRSTVGPRNTATQPGGGIYNGGTADVTNSTVSGNSATGGQLGGIYNDSTVTLLNVTVAENPGGGLCDPVSGMQLWNTLVGDNPGGDCTGTPVSNGYNLDSDGSCGLGQPGDQAGVDPVLGPLADNGGPNLTHALLRGSPALETIPEWAGGGGFNGAPGTDQRGVLRPRGDNCDTGAYEGEPPPLVGGVTVPLARAGMMLAALVVMGLVLGLGVLLGKRKEIPPLRSG